ncbi:hypothetical protein [Coleofasciculus chthonoplastes]|uniref:hypothetical protein n=1 Tax=Coleofasciculus chthonoplastes TaxID=64178 RepID=UPI0032F94139
MIRYILDTDHLSLFQREHPLVMQRVNATDPQTMAVTIITISLISSFIHLLLLKDWVCSRGFSP